MTNDTPPTAAGIQALPPTISVAHYLSARLRELGVHHLFGLPGDYNLTLLDELIADGLEWVGSANELNSAYAADAAARVLRGPAAICTVFGVGELSAINGIAGAYAEDVPLISIVGGPTLRARAAGTLLHHTLVDGDYGHFARAVDEVTVASTVLTPANAPREIDRVLRSALSASKPVSIGVPTDVVRAEVSSAGLQVPLRAHPVDPELLGRLRDTLAERVAGSRSLILLAGPRVQRRRLESQLEALANVPGVRIASQAGSKGVIDESHPGSLGTYIGALTESDEVRRIVDDAGPLVLVGAVLSDMLTGGFSHRFDAATAIELGLDSARVGDIVFPGIGLADSLAAVHEVAAGLAMEPAVPFARRPAPAPVRAPAADEVTQQSFWSEMQHWLTSDTYLIADPGSAFFGALKLRMPDRSDLLAQFVWSSIGYSLPATLGAALADPARRSVCIIGDGAAQLTIQELGVILARGLAPVIIFLDNGGYTIERIIQSPDAVYQDVVGWDWAALPAVLAPTVRTNAATVRSVGDLTAALDTANADREHASVIRVVLDRDDVPPLMARFGAALAAGDQ